MVVKSEYIVVLQLYAVCGFLLTVARQWISNDIILCVHHYPCPFTFPEVTLRLSCHFTHDFRSIDEKEESSCFIGHCPGDERLTSTRGTVEEDTTRRLHSNGSEELGVTERQLYHLTGGVCVCVCVCVRERERERERERV